MAIESACNRVVPNTIYGGYIINHELIDSVDNVPRMVEQPGMVEPKASETPSGLTAHECERLERINRLFTKPNN